MKPPRAIERTNPWELTELEFLVLATVVDLGSNEAAGQKLGMTQRSIENALVRAKIKMGAAHRVEQLVKFITWRLEKKAGQPRSAWCCQACSGLGFTVRRA